MHKKIGKHKEDKPPTPPTVDSPDMKSTSFSFFVLFFALSFEGEAFFGDSFYWCLFYLNKS